MPNMRINLNADLGEGYGPWTMGDDAAMLGVVSSANIACGGHAGDPDVMRTPRSPWHASVAFRSAPIRATPICAASAAGRWRSQRRNWKTSSLRKSAHCLPSRHSKAFALPTSSRMARSTIRPASTVHWPTPSVVPCAPLTRV
jgi:hypothetical protein